MHPLLYLLNMSTSCYVLVQSSLYKQVHESIIISFKKAVAVIIPDDIGDQNN